MIKNSDGLVKCFTPKGNIRWLSEHLANDSSYLKTMELTLAPVPRKLEPIIEEIEQTEFKVAEAEVADKPRKQKTK